MDVIVEEVQFLHKTVHQTFNSFGPIIITVSDFIFLLKPSFKLKF